MASASSSSHSSGTWEYEVFVCFRGGMREGFTKDVVDALTEKNIKTFMDTMLKKTESIAELVSILKDPPISVVILSPGFAESPWCLDEVHAIANRVENDGHRVLPVFYKVDPSDVTDDSGSFAAAIDHLERHSLDQKTTWRVALKDVADQAGLCFPSDEFRGEHKLIKAIVGNANELLEEMAESLDVSTTTGSEWIHELKKLNSCQR